MTHPIEIMEKRRKGLKIMDMATPLLPSQQGGSSGCDESYEASFAGAVFNLSTTIIGSGIMALPATMKILGLIPGISMLIFVPILAEASIDMLTRFSQAGNVNTYGGLMRDAFGRIGEMLIQVCVVVNIGVVVVYMIIIGDVLSGTSVSGIHHPGLLEGWFGAHWWNGRFFVLFLTSLVVFAPLVSLKNIDSLRYTSTLSVALAMVFIIITVAIAIVKVLNGSLQMPRLFPEIIDFGSIWHLCTAVPVIVTAFICHYNVHSIQNELEDSSLIQPVVKTSLALCSAIYMATSIFAFTLFGDSVLDDVLSNFDSDLGIPYSSLINDAVRISYALHLMLVFPIVFYPLRLNFDGLFFPSARPLSSDNRRFTLENIFLLSLIFLAANFIPSIWAVFQFLGATTTACVAFIFPASVALRDPHGIATYWDKILACSMIFLAVVANAIAIYSDVYSIFQKRKLAF